MSQTTNLSVLSVHPNTSENSKIFATALLNCIKKNVTKLKINKNHQVTVLFLYTHFFARYILLSKLFDQFF